jgi:hypothetical protein
MLLGLLKVIGEFLVLVHRLDDVFDPALGHSCLRFMLFAGLSLKNPQFGQYLAKNVRA